MAEAAFVASALIELPLAVAFLVVAARIHKRARLDSQPALLLFAAFWVGIGGYAIVESLWSILYMLGLAPMPVALLVLQLKLVATVAGFAGLVSYILAIRGVDGRVCGLVLGAYGVVLALTETFYTWRGPIGQRPATWGMQLVYARNDVEPWWTLLLLVLFLPPFLAALYYATLLRHTRERELRYRIALTSVSLLLFFAPLFVGWRAGDWVWWGAVEKLLAVAMAGGIVLAMWPPPALRAWLAEERPGARDELLLRRAHELL